MIRYYCDGCKNQFSRNELTDIVLSFVYSNYRKQFNWCDECLMSKFKIKTVEELNKIKNGYGKEITEQIADLLLELIDGRIADALP